MDLTNYIGIVVICGLALLAHITTLKPVKPDGQHNRLIVLLIYGMAALQVFLILLNLRASHEKDTEMIRLVADVQGGIDGGDSYAVVQIGEDVTGENLVEISLRNEGQYPLEKVLLRITDETDRFNKTGTKSSRYVGAYQVDVIPKMGRIRFPSIRLDPAVTNYYRFDISALNGFSWEIAHYYKETNVWKAALTYRFRKVGEQITIEPEKFKGALMVY